MKEKYTQISVDIKISEIYFCDMLIDIDPDKAVKIDDIIIFPGTHMAECMCRNRAYEEIDGALVCPNCKDLRESEPERIRCHLSEFIGKEYQKKLHHETTFGSLTGDDNISDKDFTNALPDLLNELLEENK